MLSKRLEAIYNCINDNEVVADIGTDHAYLPCELIKTGKCQKVYACDVKEGPLNQARKAIEQFGYSDQIEVVLSDGLDKVSDDVTTIVIAGMGAYTIVDILEANISKLDGYSHIILQANKNVETLRQWISDHKYTIEDEIIVLDAKKYYQIIVMNTRKSNGYSEDEIEFGTDMIKSNKDVYYEYVQTEIAKCNNILNNSTDKKKIELGQKRLEKLKNRVNN